MEGSDVPNLGVMGPVQNQDSIGPPLDKLLELLLYLMLAQAIIIPYVPHGNQRRLYTAITGISYSLIIMGRQSIVFYSLMVGIFLSGVCSYPTPAIYQQLRKYVNIQTYKESNEQSDERSYTQSDKESLILSEGMIRPDVLLSVNRCSVTFVLGFVYMTVVRVLVATRYMEMNDGMNLYMMLGILRALSFVFDFHDGRLKPLDTPLFSPPPPPSSSTSSNCRVSRQTLALEFFFYVMCFPGSWMGPFLSYETVSNLMDKPITAPLSHRLSVALRRTLAIGIHIVFFLATPHYFPILLNAKNALQFNSYWHRVLLIWAATFRARSRLTSAWLISEISCAMAGVACENEKLNLKTFETYDFFTTECSPSIKAAGRGWNCSIQTWLVIYVYKRVAILRSPFLRRMTVVMLSAVWHGVGVGYYVAFAGYTIAQTVQDFTFSRQLPFVHITAVGKFLYVMRCTLTAFLLQFWGIPFLFQNSNDFLLLWRSLYFVGFWVLGILVFIGLLCPKSKQP